MAAGEGSLVFKEELSAKRTIIRENPEGGSQTNDPAELLSIVIEEVGSRGTSLSSLFSSDDEWFNSIANAESSAGKEQGPKIPKVPDMLRNVESNKDCYDPVVVSIGPYHHGKPHLQEIEKLKIKWAKQFVEDIDDGSQIHDLGKVKKLYEEVAKVADEARKYYDIVGGMDSNEKFTRMMFLDGCFILHFIYLHTAKRNEMGMRNHLVAFVQQDLFLLENQLPYIVLKALMGKRFKGNEGKETINMFLKLTRGDLPPTPTSWSHVNFRFGNKHGSPAAPSSGDHEPDEDHLLHLLRKQFVDSNKFNVGIKEAADLLNKHASSNETTDGSGTGWHSYRSAKELKNVGIRFKANRSGKFSDVDFTSGFLLSEGLILPPLTVDDSTKSMLLNLVALETCPGGPEDFYVTSYICLMDSLLDTVEDVMVLRSHDIVMNYLGSDQQVADLFNDISKNLVPHPNVYSTVKANIEKHYKNRVRIWVAEWLHTHFSSPWTVLAFLGAIFAIALSLIQTYLAANPPK